MDSKPVTRSDSRSADVNYKGLKEKTDNPTKQQSAKRINTKPTRQNNSPTYKTSTYKRKKTLQNLKRNTKKYQQLRKSNNEASKKSRRKKQERNRILEIEEAIQEKRNQDLRRSLNVYTQEINKIKVDIVELIKSCKICNKTQFVKDFLDKENRTTNDFIDVKHYIEQNAACKGLLG